METVENIAFACQNFKLFNHHCSVDLVQCSRHTFSELNKPSKPFAPEKQKHFLRLVSMFLKVLAGVDKEPYMQPAAHYETLDFLAYFF